MNSSSKVLSSFATHNWSGGTTTELYIHPLNSNFKDLNFDFRISTATVEIGTSVFTPLPSTYRTLMVLDGEMTLVHEKQHEKELKKFDVDYFEGDWVTKSVGKCVDFNLMTRGGTTGELEACILHKNDEQTFLVNSDIFCLYLYRGKIAYKIDGETNLINQGDLFSVANFTDTEILLKSIENSEVIVCRITIK